MTRLQYPRAVIMVIGISAASVLAANGNSAWAQADAPPAGSGAVIEVAVKPEEPLLQKFLAAPRRTDFGNGVSNEAALRNAVVDFDAHMAEIDRAESEVKALTEVYQNQKSAARSKQSKVVSAAQDAVINAVTRYHQLAKRADQQLQWILNEKWYAFSALDQSFGRLSILRSPEAISVNTPDHLSAGAKDPTWSSVTGFFSVPKDSASAGYLEALRKQDRYLFAPPQNTAATVQELRAVRAEMLRLPNGENAADLVTAFNSQLDALKNVEKYGVSIPSKETQFQNAKSNSKSVRSLQSAISAASKKVDLSTGRVHLSANVNGFKVAKPNGGIAAAAIAAAVAAAIAGNATAGETPPAEGVIADDASGSHSFSWADSTRRQQPRQKTAQ